MERLSAKKKLAIVRQYLSGLSYDEMAVKSGVSKGTVANVVADLKAGRFPEAADVVDQIELLRELSLDLKRLKLTPVQCATGLIVLARIYECGLDPADIGRWPLILKSAGSDDQAQELRRIPNLPGYIDQPTVTLTSKVDSFNGYLKGYIEHIRNLIPKEALEEERKALEYGSQQSLI